MLFKNYELILIFKNMNFIYLRNKIFVIKNIINRNNCFILKFENLNKINFSYKIKKFSKGIYILFNLKLKKKCLYELIFYLKTIKDLLRFIFYKSFKINLNLFILNKITEKLKSFKDKNFNEKKKTIDKFQHFKKNKLYNKKKL